MKISLLETVLVIFSVKYLSVLLTVKVKRFTTKAIKRVEVLFMYLLFNLYYKVKTHPIPNCPSQCLFEESAISW